METVGRLRTGIPLRFLAIAAAFATLTSTIWMISGRHLGSSSFLPHAMCYLGNPRLIWTHFSADIIIGISYLAISITLGYLLWKQKRSIPFHWLFVAFGMFIIACGGTHLMEAVTLWRPYYWLAAYIKAITAGASLITAVALPMVMPAIIRNIELAKLSEERKIKLEVAYSDLARMNAELQESDRIKSRFIAQNAAKIGDWEWNIQTGQVRWSEAVEEIHGFAPGTFSGRYEDWLACVHPDDAERVAAAVTKALEEISEYDVEYRSLRPDGSAYWTAARGKIVTDKHGKPAKLLGMCMDVTSLRQATMQLEIQAKLINMASDAVLVIDVGGRIVSWNRGAERLYGFSKEQAHGQIVHELLRTEFPNGDSFGALLRDGEWRGELRHHTRDGQTVIVQSRWTSQSDEKGNPIGWIEINRDITQQKQAEELLRRSEKLAAAGRLSATIAHEINNPLEAVMNLLFLVANDKDIPLDAKKYLDEAQDQLSRVSHIARKTLGFYRESSHPERVKISRLLDDVIAIYAGKLQAKSIDVKRRYRFEGTVLGVPGEFAQVFSNLIANALDAMDAGGQLWVSTAEAGGGLDCIRITVADNGCGIDRELKEKVFEPFFTTKKDIGTGLGLWVSQELVAKYNGRIRVRSAVNPERHGTVFSIFLPLNAAESAIVKAAS